MGIEAGSLKRGSGGQKQHILDAKTKSRAVIFTYFLPVLRETKLQRGPKLPGTGVEGIYGKTYTRDTFTRYDSSVV